MHKESVLFLGFYLLSLLSLNASKLHIAGTLQKMDGLNLEDCRMQLGCTIEEMYDAIFESPTFTERSRCMLACLLVSRVKDKLHPEASEIENAKTAVEVNNCAQYGIEF